MPSPTAERPAPPLASTDPKRWALYYLSLGLHPLPMAHGDKRPGLDSWKPYQERQPTPEELEGWDWSAGVGITTNGFALIDCDDGGEALLADRPFPPSWTVRSGGGGLHRYFRVPAGRPCRNVTALLKEEGRGQVDVKAEGGFAVLPPSIHPETRKPYEWIIPPWSPVRLADVPPWVLEEMQRRSAGSRNGDEAAARHTEPWVSELLRGVPEGQRNDGAAKLAGYFASKGLPEDIALALLEGYAARCLPPFPSRELRETVRSIYTTHSRNERPPVGGEAAGPWTAGLSTLLSVPDEPIPWLAERLLVGGANGFIGGEPKSLKSWLALYLGLCLALGVPVFGRYGVPQPVRVLYLQEEDGTRRVRRRVRRLLRGLGREAPDDALFRYSIKVGLLLDDKAWLVRLRAELAEYRPAIVIGDVFELMHTRDADRRAELKPVFYSLDRLREEFGCGFLLADHFKKQALGGSKRGGQRLAGTVGKHAWGETSLYLFPGPGKNRVAVQSELKDAPSETFGLALEDTPEGGVVFTWSAETEDRAADMKAKILEAVGGLTQPGGWVTAAQVGEAAGVTRNTARKYLDLLVDEDQRLEREQRQAGKVRAWYYRLTALGA